MPRPTRCGDRRGGRGRRRSPGAGSGRPRPAARRGHRWRRPSGRRWRPARWRPAPGRRVGITDEGQQGFAERQCEMRGQFDAGGPPDAGVRIAGEREQRAGYGVARRELPCVQVRCVAREQTRNLAAHPGVGMGGVQQPDGLLTGMHVVAVDLQEPGEHHGVRFVEGPGGEEFGVVRGVASIPVRPKPGLHATSARKTRWTGSGWWCGTARSSSSATGVTIRNRRSKVVRMALWPARTVSPPRLSSSMYE